MTKVKICGITNIDDALVAVEAGADYLGFILWESSKRSVTPDDTKKIVAQLREKQSVPILVGVFVNEPVAKMAELLAWCDLDLAQLSGDEVPAFIGSPQSPIYNKCYKAIRPTSLDEAEAEAEWYLPPEPNPNYPSLLIDTYHPTLRGGTGETVDWGIAANLAGNLPNFMLAGGLNPENVGDAVRQVKPYAVDVASGVEKNAGIKDHKAIYTFIQRAKGNNCK
jgi:phosphoribosylanthranilate isomerase